ncbi:rRNA maturation RNase YbeY [Laribacter hongkongensis]|uniref:rRNA maturation RNase YbeY n=1 Tax=Laribacter hongkongensis TaxID=168471 RepID=UPI0003F874AF|nr:rRNA maturation RNase YbeY [Laribacter hongkongensis]MCG9093772.1 rRNA maturation RNase YbeY [Laribacter hongkongensis]
MKLAKTRFRPAPRELDLNIDYRVAATGLPRPSDFARWVSAALQGRSRAVQIGLHVVDNAEGQRLNAEYRGKDAATNVLSFALNEGDEAIAGLPLMGDIVLAAEVVAREAAEQDKDLHAHYAHLTVHGMLHLQGYDHETDAEAETMEALETVILARLGYTDPYAVEH